MHVDGGWGPLLQKRFLPVCGERFLQSYTCYIEAIIRERQRNSELLGNEWSIGSIFTIPDKRITSGRPRLRDRMLNWQLVTSSLDH
jgi:hypothetical protein